MILALRALKLGDLLVAVPALRAIRRFWPDERLVLAASGWPDPALLGVHPSAVLAAASTVTDGPKN